MKQKIESTNQIPNEIISIAILDLGLEECLEEEILAIYADLMDTSKSVNQTMQGNSDTSNRFTTPRTATYLI